MLASIIVVTAYKGVMATSFLGLGTMKVAHLYSVKLVPACGQKAAKIQDPSVTAKDPSVTQFNG